MNKNHNSRFTVLLLILCLITSLICGVSCSDSVDSDVDEVRTVSFSSGENSSRGLGTEQTLEHPIEELYWAYTAVKKSGSYTIGQSEKDPNPSASITAIQSDTTLGTSTWKESDSDDQEVRKAYNDGIDGVHAAGYMLKPVKAGAAPGLSGTVGPFSVGKWEFRIFGYEKYNEEKNRFEGLIYTGVVNNYDGTNTSEIDKSDNNPQIIFELGNKGATAMGIFTVGNMFITVPEDKMFFGDEGANAEVIVKVFDVSYITTDSKPVLIAQSVTPITKNTKVTLNTKDKINAEIAIRKVLEGDTTLVDYTNENNVGAFDGVFKPGMSIVLNGFSLVERPASESDRRTDLHYVEDGVTVDSKVRTAVDAKTNWARLFPEDHKFKVVAEYKDSYSSGKNIYTDDNRYDWAGDDLILFDKGYEQVGTINEYVLPIISGVKTTIFGDINDLQWAEGETQDVDFGYGVAKIIWTLTDDSIVTDYYDTLNAACLALNADPQVTKTGKAVSTTTPATEIVLLTAVENDSVPDDAIVRYNNVKFLHNITITSGKTLTLELAADATADTNEATKREYKFTGGTIVNFTSSGASANDVWITMSGATATEPVVEISAEADSVRFSGAASSLVVKAIDATDGLFLGTTADTNTTVVSVGTLEITKGRLEIGSRACIGTLTSKGDASGDVVLKSASDAVVQKYVFGTTTLFDTTAPAIGAVVNDAAVENAVDYAGFKEIQLINGTTTKYIYVIEGLPVTLPSFGMASTSATDYECGFTVDAPNAFMHWNTDYASTSVLPTGTSYADKAKFALTTATLTTENKLYAVIAQPIGGRIFNLGTEFDASKYAFYGVAKGTLNELTEWKTATDKVKKLTSAVYYIKAVAAASTSPVSVVYTQTDPTLSVTADPWYFTPSGSTDGKVIQSAATYTAPTPPDTTWGYTDWANGTEETYQTLLDSGVADYLFDRLNFWTSDPVTHIDATGDVPAKDLYTYWDWARQVFDKTELEYNNPDDTSLVTGPKFNFMVFRNI